MCAARAHVLCRHAYPQWAPVDMKSAKLFDKLDDTGVDLLLQMFKYNPDERITVRLLYSHAWPSLTNADAGCVSTRATVKPSSLSVATVSALFAQLVKCSVGMLYARVSEDEPSVQSLAECCMRRRPKRHWHTNGFMTSTWMLWTLSRTPACCTTRWLITTTQSKTCSEPEEFRISKIRSDMALIANAVVRHVLLRDRSSRASCNPMVLFIREPTLFNSFSLTPSA